MDRRHCGCLLAHAVPLLSVAQSGMSQLVSAHMWQRLRLWHQARLPQFASAVRRLDGAVCKNAPSPEHHLCGEPKFRRFRTLSVHPKCNCMESARKMSCQGGLSCHPVADTRPYPCSIRTSRSGLRSCKRSQVELAMAHIQGTARLLGLNCGVTCNSGLDSVCWPQHSRCSPD